MLFGTIVIFTILIFFNSNLIFVPFLGLFHCPFKRKLCCSLVFASPQETWKHAKTHGPEHFPWVCRICEHRVFVGAQGILRHWLQDHPHIEHPKQIVHPRYGNHYSHL